jgi:hypothetical protein
LGITTYCPPSQIALLSFFAVREILLKERFMAKLKMIKAQIMAEQSITTQI